MRVTVETTIGLQRKATIAVPSAAFEAEVAAGLRQAAGDLKLPGFRPGKVPMKEVRRRLEPAVRGQVAKDLSIASFSEAMREQPFTLATQAQIEIANLNQGADLEFTATFEVLPEIELAPLGSLKVRRPQATIEEADIDFTIEEMRLQRGEWAAVERPVREGDRVVVDCMWKRGDEVVRERQGLTFLLNEHFALGAMKKALIGMVVDEVRRFPLDVGDEADSEAQPGAPLDAANAPTELLEQAPQAAVVDPPAVAADSVDEGAVATALPLSAPQSPPQSPPQPPPQSDVQSASDEGLAANQDAADALGDADAHAASDAAGQDDAQPPAGAAGDDSTPLRGECVLRSVEAPTLPDIDDALFDWFGVEAGDDRLAKFRAAVRERMELEMQAAARRASSQEVLAALGRAHDFDVPPTLVRAQAATQLERIAEVLGDLPPEVGQGALRNAEHRLRGQLALREVIARESLAPDDKRVAARVDEIASAYEEAAQVRSAIYRDEDRLRQIELTVLEEQALDHVLSQADVYPVDMPYRDLVAGRPLPKLPEAAIAPPAASARDVPQAQAPAAGSGGQTAKAQANGVFAKVKRLFAKG